MPSGTVTSGSPRALALQATAVATGSTAPAAHAPQPPNPITLSVRTQVPGIAQPRPRMPSTLQRTSRPDVDWTGLDSWFDLATNVEHLPNLLGDAPFAPESPEATAALPRLLPALAGQPAVFGSAAASGGPIGPSGKRKANDLLPGPPPTRRLPTLMPKPLPPGLPGIPERPAPHLDVSVKGAARDRDVMLMVREQKQALHSETAVGKFSHWLRSREQPDLASWLRATPAIANHAEVTAFLAHERAKAASYRRKTSGQTELTLVPALMAAKLQLLRKDTAAAVRPHDAAAIAVGLPGSAHAKADQLRVDERLLALERMAIWRREQGDGPEWSIQALADRSLRAQQDERVSRFVATLADPAHPLHFLIPAVEGAVVRLREAADRAQAATTHAED